MSTRFQVVLFLLSLCLTSGVYGQNWSAPLVMENSPGLTMQWRLYGLETKSQKNAFEWVFQNLTDSTVSFDYSIATNKDEKRLGRITLAPHKQRFSGWPFDGDRIVDVRVGSVMYRKGD